MYRFSSLTLLIVMGMVVIFVPLNTASAGSTVHSKWVLLPGWVYSNTWVEAEIAECWDLEAGVFAEGRLHRAEKTRIEPDLLNLTHSGSMGSLQAGYIRPSWGTEQFDSIMLSGLAPSFPGIYGRTSIYGLDYERFCGWFEDRGSFFGHRLELPLTEGVKLGIKETVIYSDEFEGFWLNYIPLWPFYLIKYIPAPPTRTHNMNVGLDLLVERFEDFKIYGDFHVSEWPFLPESNQPPLFALKLGIYHEDLFGEDLQLLVEYQRIMNYVYSTRVPEQYYQYRGWSLGSELGNDAEEIALKLKGSINDDLNMSLGLKYGRMGEGEIGDYWSSFEEAHENLFLTGVVEDIITPTAGITYQLASGVEIELGLEVGFVNNKGHEEGEKGTRTGAYLYYSSRF